MVKKLVQYGRNTALEIDQPILDMLQLTNITSFDITTDGRNLILSPKTGANREKIIVDSLAKINKQYRNVFKRLAE